MWDRTAECEQYHSLAKYRHMAAIAEFVCLGAVWPQAPHPVATTKVRIVGYSALFRLFVPFLPGGHPPLPPTTVATHRCFLYETVPRAAIRAEFIRSHYVVMCIEGGKRHFADILDNAT